MAVPYAVAARDLLRNSLLDAARELLETRGWDDVKMADIAGAAGVSRQTLYNEFGSRDAIGQAFVIREGERFLIAVEQAIRERLDDPGAALTAAFDVFLTAAADDPLVRTIVFGEGGGMLALVTTQGKPVVEFAAERLEGIIVEGWPQVSRRDAGLLAEALVRLAISYAALPSGPTTMTAESVTRLLGPYLDQILTPKR